MHEDLPGLTVRAGAGAPTVEGALDSGEESPGGNDPPKVLTLDDERATEATVAGGKGAALARATRAGLPVLPGLVVTVGGTAEIERTGWDGRAGAAVRAAWEELSDGGKTALVVRSSSTAEDLDQSSMAGRFTSIIGVRGWDEFRHAVGAVVDSRRQAADGESGLSPDHPMAVLVQPLLEPHAGGVMFGVDPVTGRSDRLVVAAVEGGPDRLVSGEVEGSRYELDGNGACVSRRHGPGGAPLRSRELRRLAALAAEVSSTFGGPQDVEWAIDTHGALWLLQSRPVTTEVRGVPAGPVLGPGPVSETFPEPLAPLEEDLWLDPLREALRAALGLAGVASPRQLERSPVVVSVGGRAAVDLELLGEVPAHPGVRRRFDPGPRLRRLRAAWRVGRLRAALPHLARDLVERTDAELAQVPPLDELSDRQLLAVLERCRSALRALHGHEVLIGLVVDPGASRLTGPAVALRVLAQARGEGLSDDEILRRHPVVLALVPPRIGPAPALPPLDQGSVPPLERPPEGPGGGDTAVLREALRLRVRWVQELSGRAAFALGRRLGGSGALDPSVTPQLGLDELRALATGRQHRRPVAAEQGASRPVEALPARFRLSDRGLPVPVLAGADRAGTGAGGGSGTGPVHHGPDPPEGSVLVVRTLDPALAPVLGRLGGLVAETGSVLAHAAILAREAGVPTVVGLAGATERFRPGTLVRVDGDTGEVVAVHEEER